MTEQKQIEEVVEHFLSQNETISCELLRVLMEHYIEKQSLQLKLIYVIILNFQ